MRQAHVYLCAKVTASVWVLQMGFVNFESISYIVTWEIRVHAQGFAGYACSTLCVVAKLGPQESPNVTCGYVQDYQKCIPEIWLWERTKPILGPS